MKKQNITIKFFSLIKSFSDYTESEKLVSLGNSIELLALIRQLGWRVIAACALSSVNLSNRSRQVYNFGKYILIMRKHHGVTFTVSYLKASQLAVQKRIGEDRITSLRDLVPDLPLPRLSSSRLPRYIPLRDRRAICSGSVPVIRFWLTLFSIYRVLDAPSKLKLNTITDCFSGSQIVLDKVSQELKVLAFSFKKRGPDQFAESNLLWLKTASPSMRSSWTGLILDLFTLKRLGLISSLEFFVKKYGSYSLQRLFRTILKLESLIPLSELLEIFPVKGGFDGNHIGQLSTKKEAAGKVRVFALVDVWTQTVLKPLHQWLFDFLSTLPNDGTFDQHGSVKRCMLKVKRSGCSYGYDLSAATDRLPIKLQLGILEAFFGKDLADAWYHLLVGREYVLDSKEYGKAKVKYSVGQPMGALSSWAMLAVTHHLIVQLCAQRVGKRLPGHWYEDYELLGDDIILFDGAVAAQYLSVMEGLGVGITLSKSVVAKNETIEFAKVTGYYGANVSAISWKMFMSQKSLMGRSNIVYSLLNKDIISSEIIKWFRAIVKVSRNKSSSGYSYSLLAVLSMYLHSGRLPIETLSKALTDILNPRKQAYKNALEALPLARLESILVMLANHKSLPSFSKGDRFWWQDEMSMKGDIYESINLFKSRFDFNKIANQLTDEMTSFLLCTSFCEGATWMKHIKKDILNPETPEQNLIFQFRDCLLQCIITSNVRSVIDVFSSTYAVSGMPMYLTWSLEEGEIESLKGQNAMVQFGKPLDSYWMKVVSLKDNLLRLPKMVTEAKAKVAGDESAKVVLESPLKPLKFLLKGRRGWTKKYG